MYDTKYKLKTTILEDSKSSLLCQESTPDTNILDNLVDISSIFATFLLENDATLESGSLQRDNVLIAVLVHFLHMFNPYVWASESFPASKPSKAA
jgi:hypothetical protein